MEKPVFLVCHRGALGDFLLCLPVLSRLKAHYHTYRFAGLGKPDYLSFARQAGIFDDIFDCESRAFLPFFQGRSIPEDIQALKKVVAWMKCDETFSKSLDSKGIDSIFHPPFPEKPCGHMLEYNSGILGFFSLPDKVSTDFSYIYKTKKTELVHIHAGSGSPQKNFDPGFYILLADELTARGFPNIQFISGPCERSFEEIFTEKFTVRRPSSISELASIISGSRLFLGNDSGVSHLAGLLGVPSIALYKNTSPAIWGIVGNNVHHVEAPLESIAMAKIGEILSENTF